MVKVSMKKGDVLPALKVVFEDIDGPVVLPVGATVTFRMGNNGTTKVDAAAVITDADAGEVEYQWVTADTDTTGTYQAEFKLVYPAGDIRTFPNDEYITVVIHNGIAEAEA